jgi:plasmid stabilization system protein ParE
VSPYVVESTPEADEHARRFDAWWRMERPDAPHIFVDELARAISLIGAMPAVGARFVHGRGDLRRLLLRRCGCHLYYSADHDRRLVVIRAIWHAARGERPLP